MQAIRRFVVPALLALATAAVLSPALQAQTAIYVADYDAQTLKVYSGTNFSTVTLVGGGLSAPAGIAVAANGDVYVASQQSGGYVTKFTLTGSSYSAGSQIITGLDSPTALAFDSSGNLYIANFGGSVGKYDASGNAINASLITGLSGASGIAFDSSGNIYVTAYNTGSVSKYASTGGSSIASTGGIAGAFGVAVSPAGDVYVASADNNKIFRFDSNLGSATSITSPLLNRPTAIAISGSSLFVDNQFGSEDVVKFNLALSSGSQVLSGIGTSFGLAVIPEPSTYAALFGAVALGAAAVRNRRRRTAGARSS